MKKIIVLLISLLSHTSGYDSISTPTLITLKIESSEILSDSEGTQFSITNTSLIIQIDENSFEIIGEII